MPKKTIKQIKAELPQLNSEKVEVLADELDRIEALKTLFRSDGGKELLAVLKNNCSSTLHKLYSSLDDAPSLDKLISLISRYKANIDLLAELQDIKMETEINNQLDEAVKEALALLP